MNSIVYHFLAMLSIVRSEILPVGTVNNEFNMFVEDLILKHFNSSDYIGIFYDNEGILSINLPQLLEKLDAPVIIHDLLTPEVVLGSPDVWIPPRIAQLTNDNIIIIEDSKDLEFTLKVLLSIPFFSARTKVFIIFTGRVVYTESWIREIFSQLWKIYILNVGLVFYNGMVNLLTYLRWTTPHEIQNLTDQGISANIFYNKIKNLHGYQFKVLVKPDDLQIIASDEDNSTTYLGVDGMTMRTIFEHYNATSNIINLDNPGFLSPCRFVHYNYTIQGLFGADTRNTSIPFCPFSLQFGTFLKRPSELEVLGKKTDVFFNSRPFRFDMDYRVDTPFVQRSDNYCILIPAKKETSQAITLLLPLQIYIWLVILVNFIIHSTIYFGIQSLNKSNKKGFLHTCLTLYRIQMNSVAPNLEKFRTSENVYLLCWVLYSFIISAAYQSVLISFITVPLYAPPIDRIKDLKNMDFSIFTAADILIDMFKAIDRETDEILRAKMVPHLWTGQRKFYAHNGYLLQKSIAQYVSQRKDLMDEHERPFFHLMEECPMPQLMSYPMPRGSPLLQMINELTLRKAQSGLEKIWQAEARRYLNRKIPKRSEWHGRHISLTSVHLKGAFYIFFAGQLLAIGAFLVEFFWKRIKSFIVQKCTTNTPE